MECRAFLWILGMPLQDFAPLCPALRERLVKSDLLIGESRKATLRFLSQVPDAEHKPLFFLDDAERPAEKEWFPAVQRLAKEGGIASLFSDTGMPMLFDPGRDVLAACQRLGFSIRSFSGPTSWGSACALSGWMPPFFVVGFPPRDPGKRFAFWNAVQKSPGHLVLMERPYRFLPLLKECRVVFGGKRSAFLAWELDSPSEKLLWGSLNDLERQGNAFEKHKGEFVLLIGEG